MRDDDVDVRAVQRGGPFVVRHRTEPKDLYVWVSHCVEIKFYGAFVLNHRVAPHAIDATPARWRGDAGSSPLDRARTAASHVHPAHWLISTQVWRHLMAGNDAVHELSKDKSVGERVSGRLLWGARPARRVAFLQGARK